MILSFPPFSTPDYLVFRPGYPATLRNLLPALQLLVSKDPLRTRLGMSRARIESRPRTPSSYGDADKFQDLEVMEKAKDAYERARVSFCPPPHSPSVQSSFIDGLLQLASSIYQGEP